MLSKFSFKKFARFTLMLSLQLSLFTVISFAASTNPFEEKALEFLKEMRGWIAALGVGITLLVVAYHAFTINAVTRAEKEDKKIVIRDTILWGVGATFLVWFANYAFTYFKGIGVI